MASGNEAVPSKQARAIRRTPGANILIVNQSAVDVYVSSNISDLIAFDNGAVPSGSGATKIAATGGQATITSWPRNGLWCRAISDTFLSVPI